ncbi:hypothetical protein KI387_021400, partial [Taxus chinensis]
HLGGFGYCLSGSASLFLTPFPNGFFGTWFVVLVALAGSAHPRVRADVGAQFNLTCSFKNISVRM